MALIYITTNTVNGKVYIGQKRDNAPASYIGGGTKLQHAIRKYGRKAFTHRILMQCMDYQADMLERLFIWRYRSQEDNIGYNIQPGGAPNTSEVARLKMKTFRKGIVFSETHRANLSKSRKGCARTETTIEKWKVSIVGYRHSDETRQAISQGQLGGKKAKTVWQLDSATQERIAQYRGGEALKAAGFNQSKVSECALGKRKTHKGFCWEYDYAS